MLFCPHVVSQRKDANIFTPCLLHNCQLVLVLMGKTTYIKISLALRNIVSAIGMVKKGKLKWFNTPYN